MQLRRTCAFAIFLALGGCGGSDGADAATPADAIVERDVGASIDAVVEDVDVADDDGALDATLEGGPHDATLEAAVDAACSHAVATEACNAFDDDCDGRIDESACAGCTVEVAPGDRVFAFCPRVITGIEAWTGVCEDLGPGYRLADLDDPSEVFFLTDRIGARRLWIGLRTFASEVGLVDSQGVPRDRASIAFDPADAQLDGERCATFGGEGVRSELCVAPTARHGALCEAPLAASTVVGPPESCNGEDDDLDGPIDEGACTDCRGVRFVDHHYQVCTEQTDWDTARARCEDHGMVLVSVDSVDENAAVNYARTTDIAAWLGATDDPARLASASTGVYRWLDGRAVSDGYTNFGDRELGGQPCLSFRPGIGYLEWEDRACDAVRSYVCEQVASEGP